MASKGKNFNSYSPEFKKEVLEKYFSNLGSAGSLAKEYGIPSKTIKNWVAKSKKGIDVTIDHRPGNSGRKSKSDNENYKEKYEILKKFQAFLKAQREQK